MSSRKPWPISDRLMRYLSLNSGRLDKVVLNRLHGLRSFGILRINWMFYVYIIYIDTYSDPESVDKQL